VSCDVEYIYYINCVLCVPVYRKSSSEVRLYQKPAADCCPETAERDDAHDVNAGHHSGYNNYSRTSRTDCDVTPYVTPPAQPTCDVDETTRSSERIIRCSVCATIITSRSDGDVRAAGDQSRHCISGSAVDDVIVPV